MKKAINKKQVILIIIIYLAFIALGLPDTGFGVAWNEMRLEFKTPLEAAGAVTMIVTLFSALSGFSSGYLLNKFGTGRVTAFSCLATAVAILGYTFSPSYWFLLIMAVPLGFGAGAVDSGLNAYAAENLSAKHMNWLHGCWGIGATLSPLIITFGIGALGSWRYGYGMIGATVLLLSIIILISLPLWKTSHHDGPEQDETVVEKPYIKGVAPLLSVMTYVIYVGIEGGLGLWLSSLLIESRGLNIEWAGTIVGLYFGSIMVGRFLMGAFANRFENRKIVDFSLFIAFIGGVLFCIPSTPILYGLGILFIGLGFAPIYPTLMHETSNRYGGEQAKKVIGNQVAFSYVSMLVFVPALGFIATHTFLEIIPYITVAMIVALYLVVRKLNQLT